MRINEAGLEILKSFEGWRPNVYHCGARWTIGWGSTYDLNGDRITPNHPDIDEVEGEALLRQEIRHVERTITRVVKAPLNENQFSALCSFTYNVGSGNFFRSTMRQKISRLDYEGAADEFPKWRRSVGKILPGLVRRRISERALFLS
jgi:lysozyme|tara:strand:- start:3834 stop:4274 length:441 start_codon:yes stop_codon:yes gene_type:complete